MEKFMRLTFGNSDALVTNVREINSTFAVGSLKVMYTGENRNGSFMTRRTVEEALPSLYNVPIVCHYDCDENIIGSHDIELASDSDGNIRIRNLTEPCGVVPESATFRFSVEQDENGVVHEYLVIDGVLLWKRQDVYHHIVDDLDGKVKHSMEIHVLDGDVDSGGTGLYVIKKFEFTALCLLERAEPCFEGSELELFAADVFKQKMEQMMADLKETFAQVIPVEQDNDINENDRKGGEVLEYNEKELMEEVEQSAAEQAEQAEEETPAEQIAPESAAEESDADETTANEQSGQAEYALNSQVEEAIREELSRVTVETEFGEWPRYWMCDFDPDAGMVYCYDELDWKLYGFPYTMNGDNAVIDFENGKRMKIAIVEFDEGEQPSPIASVFQAAAEKFRSNDESWAEKFQTASEQMAQMNTELGELRAFKSGVEQSAAQAEREQTLGMFAELNGDEAFEALRRDAEQYSAEELAEKCYAILGRRKATFSRQTEQKAAKLPVLINESTPDDEPYHGLFIKRGFGRK